MQIVGGDLGASGDWERPMWAATQPDVTTKNVDHTHPDLNVLKTAKRLVVIGV